MSITLYYCPGSVQCGLVLLTARTLNLAVDLKSVDLLKLEQMTPEYLKINPQHTVPTLVDGDLVLWESRAIVRYLAAKHGSTLYPQELKTRAVVDHRLDFDFGLLYRKYAEYYYPQIFEQKAANKAIFAKLQESLGYLNSFLEESQYVAGVDLTIADFACVATIASVDASGIDLQPYPNIVRWFQLMKSTLIGYKETIQESVDKFMSILDGVKNGTVKWNM